MKKWLLGLGISVALVGCGNNGAENVSTGGDSSTDDEPANDEGSTVAVELDSEVEIDFWHAMNGPHEEAVNAIIEEFNDSHEFITVKPVGQGSYNDLQQTIMASARANNLPVISQVTTNVIPDYVENNFVQSLDPYVYDEEIGFSEDELNDVIDIFRESSSWNGEYVTVPFSKSTRILYYNQDVLDEYGFDVPESWDDIKEISEAVKADGMVGMGFENAYEMEFEALLLQMGGEYIDEGAMEAHMGSEEGVQAMTFIKDMIDNGLARTAGEDQYMSNPFGRGDVALYIGSSAGLPHVAAAADGNIEWGTTVLPTHEEKEAVGFAGNDIIMFDQATDEEKAAAWEFMKHITSTDVTANWAMDTGYLPVRYSSYDLDEYQAFIEEQPKYAAAGEQFDAGFFTGRVPGGNTIRNIVIEELEEILLDRKTVEEGLQSAQDRANAELSNN
ncbi:ABC transporter substrate-binding protein [Bacillus sp. FJAT-45037]|uniref:ABC transporter substrate-binding protein n=1 Tax=Bacillus sp. FJAT-45037 TaxID=2011007 RepID=UPI000C232EB0|nr:ABC transporter substrate-binding protein [Bacillus sp. FJAT-45037]